MVLAALPALLVTEMLPALPALAKPALCSRIIVFQRPASGEILFPPAVQVQVKPAIKPIPTTAAFLLSAVALNAVMAIPVPLLNALAQIINFISQEPALLVRVIVYVQFGILMAVVKSHIIIAAKK